MEKIYTDFKQQNLKIQAKFFKPFNRDAAPLIADLTSDSILFHFAQPNRKHFFYK